MRLNRQQQWLALAIVPRCDTPIFLINNIVIVVIFIIVSLLVLNKRDSSLSA